MAGRKRKVGRPKNTPQSEKAKKLIAAKLKAYWNSAAGKKRKAAMKKKGGVKKTTARKTTARKATAPKTSAGKRYRVRLRTYSSGKKKRGRPPVKKRSAPMK